MLEFIKSREHLKYKILISLLIIFILINYYNTITFTHIEMIDGTGNIRKIEIPFEEKSTENKVYIFRGKMHCSNFSHRLINVIPDDTVEYIKINDEIVSPDKMDIKSLSGFINGFDVDVSGYIHPGENNFEIKLLDYGGTFGLDIDNSSRDKLYILTHVIILLLFSILLYYFFDYLRLKRKLLFSILFRYKKIYHN